MKTLLLALLLSPPLWAGETEPAPKAEPKTETVVTLSGGKYEKAVIEPVNPAAVKITHDAGIALVRFTELPPELQARLGYDAEKEKAWVKAMWATQAAARVAAARRQVAQEARDAVGIKASLDMARQVHEMVAAGGEMVYDPITRQVVVRYPGDREALLRSALEYRNK